MEDITNLASAWLAYKAAEDQAKAKRREVEDKLAALMRVDAATEGITKSQAGAWQIKAESRLTRKVDADKIQEAAAEAGLTHLLPNVCRWKPELDMRVWKALPEESRKALAPAITTTAGRPSFSLTAINKE